MVAPTAADIQDWTELDSLKSASAATAQRLVDIAVAMFKRITGLTGPLFDSIDSDTTPLVNRAIQGLTEMMVLENDAERLDTLGDYDLISSFSAGPYSETRRAPNDARMAKLIVAWPWLSELLWTLLTPDQYDWWRAFFSDVNAPAWCVSETDWSGGSELWGTYDPLWKLWEYDPYYGPGF